MNRPLPGDETQKGYFMKTVSWKLALGLILATPTAALAGTYTTERCITLAHNHITKDSCRPMDSKRKSCAARISGGSINITLGQSSLVGTVEKPFTSGSMIPRYDLSFGGLTRGMAEVINGKTTIVEVYVNDDNSGKKYTRYACAVVDKSTRNALVNEFKRKNFANNGSASNEDNIQEASLDTGPSAL